MDMKDHVEFVALTKEEVEQMIAKAALAGASVAAETLEKAHQKEQKELKDRRLHNTRLLLRNYRMLRESCSKAIYQKEHSEKSTEEVIEDLMSMRASDGVIVNSIKESAERTGIIISHVDRMLDVFRMYCGKCGEKEKRQYKVIKSMYITKEGSSAAELAKKFGVSKVTIYDDIKTAEGKTFCFVFLELTDSVFIDFKGLRDINGYR